jgi:hypothetical protein
MIKIIDNLLTPSYVDAINDLARNHLQYSYMSTTSYDLSITENIFIDNVKDYGQMSCVIIDNALRDRVNFSWAFEQLKPIFWQIKDLVPEVQHVGRVKFNILLQQENAGYHYNLPHQDDITNNSISMVYYLDDSDGDTFLFNEFYSDPPPNKLTIAQRISPKRNRAVLFESNRYHASSNPINSRDRFIINWVFAK